MLFGLLMSCVLAATAAELAEFQTVRGRLLVLGRYVIATLAIRALQYDVVSRHKLIFQFSIVFTLAPYDFLFFAAGFARNRFTQRRKAPKDVRRKVPRALFDHL